MGPGRPGSGAPGLRFLAAALAFRAKEIGTNLTKDELDLTYSKFLEWADRKKEIDDNDLVHIIAEAKELATVI